MRLMNKIILFFTFSILFVSLLANPAPVSIELEDLILIALPFSLSLLCFAVTRQALVYKVQYELLTAILFYCAYLILSMLLGLLHNVPLLNILRAIGPYLNFVPLLAISLLPPRTLSPWALALLLILIGALQACFQLYLYFSHSLAVINTQDVLRGRITLLNPRATLPLVLSVAVLPFAFIARSESSKLRSFLVKNLAISLLVLGLLGGVVTLTRSIVLSIFFGWFLFLMLYIYQELRANKIPFSRTNSKVVFSLLSLLLLFFAVSLVPKIQMLEQGLFDRFYSASFSKSTDYSNGRIYDEWIPALSFWMNSDFLSLFFGIGAGNTFTIASGEERSYIHNMLIYHLVYGGLFGFLASLGLYLIALKTLLTRAAQSKQTIYLAFASLLGSLFFYGQFFAVHKGLAFNAMLFLILAMALYQPEKIG